MNVLGPTMADIRDPGRAIRKREERVQHIDHQIAELQDKREIIESEITQIRAGKWNQ